MPYNFLSELDFGLEVFKEKIPGSGEDSYLYCFREGGGIAGVFDGCGGSGARRYEKFGGKTGAYIASRVVSETVRDWFLRLADINNPVENVNELKEQINKVFGKYKDAVGNVSKIKGSISKDFPTTAAIVTATVKDNHVQATCLWAGDSRCYLLSSDGLKQLTEDDLDGLDAMENLSADGILTNVISASKDYTIHIKTVRIDKPCILFAATDGCFGYLSTPMEFEYLLLNTLREASSVSDWEACISKELEVIAGDDFSLVGCSIGFKNYKSLKECLAQRRKTLFDKYISGISEKTYEEKCSLWKEYRKSYYSLLD